MKIGIGYQNEENAFESGRKSAESALKNGGIDAPDLGIAFCGGRVDCEEFLRGVSSVLGRQLPVVGGSAVGIITNEAISYEGHPAGIAVVESEAARHHVVAAGNLDRDERMAGEELAKKLPADQDGKLLLVFYDSIKKPPTDTTPPIMNASPLLLDGIEKHLRRQMPIAGAGLLGDFGFNIRPKQFHGSHVSSQSVVGCMLGGEITPYYRIMHGCTPKDGIYHKITKIDGPVIYEIDGKPSVEMINEMYDGTHWQQQVPVRRLTIGVNYGEKYGRFDESEYLNRLITGVLPNGEGIVIFEPDLEEGMDILFMLRDADQMLESVRQNSADLMAQIASDGKKPVFGLYIDCAGRTAYFSDTIFEEATEIQKVCNAYNIPLLGLYSGVEIAPLRGRSRGLDWTGVFLVIAEG